MTGRPSKLNEELIQNFYDEIADGLPVNYTCDLYGITRMTFSNWMKQGEDDYNSENYESLYSQFFYAIKKAQSQYVKDAKNDIRSGRPGWQGAAWWLERTRQDFMPKQMIQADEDGKVNVIIGGKPKKLNKDDNDK